MNWLSRELMLSPCYIGLCTDEKLFKKELKRLGIPKDEQPNFLKTTHADAGVHFFENAKGKNCVIVCIHKKHPKHIKRVQIDCLLVHESVHIWQYIRESIGENQPSSEFEAYAIQNIAQTLIEAYHEGN